MVTSFAFLAYISLYVLYMDILIELAYLFYHLLLRMRVQNELIC